MSQRHLVKPIVRRWPSIILLTLVGVGAAVAYLNLATPHYSAHADVLVVAAGQAEHVCRGRAHHRVVRPRARRPQHRRPRRRGPGASRQHGLGRPPSRCEGPGRHVRPAGDRRQHPPSAGRGPEPVGRRGVRGVARRPGHRPHGVGRRRGRHPVRSLEPGEGAVARRRWPPRPARRPGVRRCRAMRTTAASTARPSSRRPRARRCSARSPTTAPPCRPRSSRPSARIIRGSRRSASCAPTCSSSTSTATTRSSRSRARWPARASRPRPATSRSRWRRPAPRSRSSRATCAARGSASTSASRSPSASPRSSSAASRSTRRSNRRPRRASTCWRAARCRPTRPRSCRPTRCARSCPSCAIATTSC